MFCGVNPDVYGNVRAKITQPGTIGLIRITTDGYGDLDRGTGLEEETIVASFCLAMYHFVLEAAYSLVGRVALHNATAIRLNVALMHRNATYKAFVLSSEETCDGSRGS